MVARPRDPHGPRLGRADVVTLNAEQLEMTGEIRDSIDDETSDRRELRALAVGMHEEVQEGVYHSRVLGMASKSGLDQFRRSPAHYRAWVDGRRYRETDALRLGKAIHCAVLEPERFACDYVIAPDFGDCRKRENKIARDAWNKEHRDATVLRNAEGLATLGIIRSMVAHPLVSSLFEGGAPEVTVRWDDAATGIACKSRLDLYRQDLATVVDVKSTADASPDAFRRDMWSYGYHRQDAFYRSGLRALGAPIQHFVFVCVEKSAPHAVALYSIDADALERGELENARLLTGLAAAVARDDWPGYPETIQTLQLPRWAQEKVA
jgi:hypothetical protein